MSPRVYLAIVALVALLFGGAAERLANVLAHPALSVDVEAWYPVVGDESYMSRDACLQENGTLTRQTAAAS